MTAAVNRNVKRERRGVVIVVEEKKIMDTSDPDSEDSALCVNEEDNINARSSPPFAHVHALGNKHSNK